MSVVQIFIALAFVSLHRPLAVVPGVKQWNLDVPACENCNPHAKADVEVYGTNKAACVLQANKLYSCTVVHLYLVCTQITSRQKGYRISITTNATADLEPTRSAEDAQPHLVARCSALSGCGDLTMPAYC